MAEKAARSSCSRENADGADGAKRSAAVDQQRRRGSGEPPKTATQWRRDTSTARATGGMRRRRTTATRGLRRGRPASGRRTREVARSRTAGDAASWDPSLLGVSATLCVTAQPCLRALLDRTGSVSLRLRPALRLNVVIGEGPTRALRWTTTRGLGGGRRQVDWRQGGRTAARRRRGGSGTPAGSEDGGREAGTPRQQDAGSSSDAGGDGGGRTGAITRPRGTVEVQLHLGRDWAREAAGRHRDPAARDALSRTMGSQISVTQRRPNGEEMQTGTRFLGFIYQLGSRDPGSRLPLLKKS
ncbi:hypothetical protein Scep_028662 [Stephania cephalantha]|uniref:Uncharacterized protein n=1 Tax=Stephania cephalantha TaxID=152367 RepID=A0AAP0HNM9_9MAGN